MARKSNRKVAKKETARLKLSDYQFPGEMGAYWTAILVSVTIFPVIAIVLFVMHMNNRGWTTGSLPEAPWWYIVNFIAYPVVTIVIGNILATRHTKLLIKKSGRQAKVMPNNHSDLYRELSKLAKLACVPIPDMYVLKDDATYVYSMPGRAGTIVVSTAMRDAFTSAEFSALLAREIGHVKSRHMRLALSNLYIENANTVFKILLLPATAIQFISQGWADLADYSADRVALLLTANLTLLNVTIMKKAVIMDTQSDIATGEIQAFMDATGDMSTDSAQMERHFKIGKFMSDRPDLAERVEQLRDFLGSAEGMAAFEKMDAIRKELGIPLSESE